MTKINLAELTTLEELMYKTVKLTTNDGKVYEGTVTTFTNEFESEDGLEDIGIRYPDRVECFDITMIKTIEELTQAEPPLTSPKRAV